MSDDLSAKKPLSGPTSEHFNGDSDRMLVTVYLETGEVKISEENVDDVERNLVEDCEGMEQTRNMDTDSERMDVSQGTKGKKYFLCARCNITFSRKNNMRAHEKKFHSLNRTVCNQVCGLCNAKFHTMVDLHKHFATEHPDVELIFHDKEFFCQSDFDQWKAEIEQQTASSFYSKSVNNKNNAEVQYFRCHRSGLPTRYGSRPGVTKKRCKKSKTIKTGITCPAFIKLTKETYHEATHIRVRYQSTHVGHKCEVHKIALKKEERAKLATMLNSGIPINVVMDKIQAQFPPTKRLGLITRQDIYNVARDFKVSNLMYKDDAMAVDISVRKMVQEKYNPVLVYKPVGAKLEHYPFIEKEDFLFGICTEAQRDLLNLYGKDCLMFDSIPGANHGFYLTTVLVHDENYEGLPVAIFFSKRIASECFELFFEAIKERLPDFETKVIMTDDAVTFLNAWNKIFRKEPKHLLCAWHVMKNLTENLNSKVKNDEIRESMENHLKKLLHESDVTSFQIYLEDFMVTYKREEAFLIYFKDYCLCREEKWAFCHRKGFEIDTIKLHMCVTQSWRQQIKYGKAGSLVTKRLDKSLTIVLKAVAKKLMNRLLSIERGNPTNRVELISNRHAESDKMDKNIYSALKKGNNSFIVRKKIDQGTVTYDVEIEDDKCTCSTVCVDCNVCIHTLSCSCIDFSMRLLICKHIHFICRKFKVAREYSWNAPSAPAEEEHLVIDVTEKEISGSKENITLELMLKRPHVDLSDQRVAIEQLVGNISSKDKQMHKRPRKDLSDQRVAIRQLVTTISSKDKQMHERPRKDLSGEKVAIQQLIEKIFAEVQSSESLEVLQYVKNSLKEIQAYLEINKRCEPEREPSKATPFNKKGCSRRQLKAPKKHEIIHK